MKKMLLLVMTLALFLTAVSFTTFAEEDQIYVGFSMKTLVEERWQMEKAACEKYAEEYGIKLDVQCSNTDSNLQISQVENMITNGVDVILICISDSGALANVLNDAHEQGIKIVVYDDVLDNTWADAKIGYDFYQLGYANASAVAAQKVPGNYVFIYGEKSAGEPVQRMKQGMNDCLQPLFDEGNAAKVFEQYTTDWKAENAMAHVENAISTYGEDITAVICMNDGMASGAVQALKAAGMDGKVMVTGMDGEITAFQRIVKGSQFSTIAYNYDLCAKTAIETCIAIAKGEKLDTDLTENFGKNEFPWVAVGFDVVTKDNIDEILIDSGRHTREEIYGE